MPLAVYFFAEKSGIKVENEERTYVAIDLKSFYASVECVERGLDPMSVDEINAAIKNDIYENAFETQKSRNIRFKGKRLAEGITAAIYYCPKCNSLDSFEAEGNTMLCKCCSYELKYKERANVYFVSPFYVI